MLRWLSPVLLLAVWQTASSTGLLDPRTLAAPLDLARTAGDLWSSGQLGEAILVSLRRAGYGFLIGAAAAVALGTWVGLTKVGDALVDPLMQMVRTIPLFGLVPLFIIWFGIKEEPKVYLVALGVVIPLYLNLVAALRGVDPDLKELAVTLRLTRLERTGTCCSRRCCRARWWACASRWAPPGSHWWSPSRSTPAPGSAT